MRNECLSYTYSYGTEIPVIRLMNKISNRMQSSTQRYDRRPYGVGLLVAGFDVSINNSILKNFLFG